MMDKDVMNKLSSMLKPDVEKHFLKIAEYIQYIENQSENRLKQLQEYKKDEEIAKLIKEIEFLKRNSVYVMTDTEKLSYEKFIEEHNKECTRPSYEIRISRTPIGSIVNCVCVKCNCSKDITDLSGW